MYDAFYILIKLIVISYKKNSSKDIRLEIYIMSHILVK